VGRAVNALLGRWEGFWASGASYSAVSHGSTADVVRKAGYILANPVSAGLVQHGHEWPGVWTGPEQLGCAKLCVARPKVFFREKGDMPEQAELELTVPPGFPSAQEFRGAVAEEVQALEAAARRKFASEGRAFLGRARVLAQNPFARPRPGEPRRKLSPRVASLDKWKRIEALGRLVAFRRAYREALLAMRAGIRDAIFPVGTYLLRIQHGVRCAAYG
jgi:hypothetical protein